MTVGIIGCGAIASMITDFALEGKLDVDLKFFYDQDIEKAENLSSKVDGKTVTNVNDMVDHVDMVIEAASQQAVGKIVPPILKRGKDVIIMSVGALIDLDLKNHLENIALENKSRIYTPSGAIVGLDGIKAASIGNITEVNLVTRKPPESLGISTDKETVLYEGKASEAVRKFPMNMNVAATLSIACNMETNVKIIADPEIQHNCHEVHVVGDFGELRTTTQNRRCNTNPKTSVLAAYSAIKLLKSLNENSRIGT
ncbi:aspartate dehydrogenase [Methanobacterium sp.]|uniref:aspartate dehydrogenase n=1 Tax=Methanobacterium sp. TaxID=2164 RepID=UPI0025FF812E|nr:aspartate dehydrogenase [Methanobacterium sp.]MBI5458393.1 aspartate dehydrogenase [Methanobacterium sp.]